MAILERVKMLASQRFDLEDWNTHLSNIRTDANYHVKRFLSSGNLIVSGFEISGIGSNNATISMSNASLLFGANTSDFSWYTSESGASNITITDGELVDNTRNYVEIYLTTEDGTLITKAFRDPTGNGGLGEEFQQETNTTTSLVVNVSVLTGGFSGSNDRIPLAIIDTNVSGVIKTINDKRNLFGRLGTNSNPNNNFSFVTQDEPVLNVALSGGAGTYLAGETVTFTTGATATVVSGGTTSITIKLLSNDSYASGDTLTGSTSGAARTVDTLLHSYTGGDLDIVTEKDRYDAVTTIIKQLSGTDFWYQDLDYLNANSNAVKHIHSIVALAASSITTGDYFLINDANNINRFYVWMNKDAGGGDPKVPGHTGVEITVTTGDTLGVVGDSIATALNSLASFSAPTTGTGTILVTNADFGVCDGLIERNSGFTLTTNTSGVGEILHHVVDGEGLLQTGKNLDEAVFNAQQKIDNYTDLLKITAKSTPDQSVDISGSFVVKDDKSTLTQVINNKVLNFIGCNINFNTGTILDSEGGALGNNFTPSTIAANQYRWYAISATFDGTASDNTNNVVITVTPASADGETPELAPKATWPSFGTPIGQVVVKDNGTGGAGTINNIDASNIYQLTANGAGGGGAGSTYLIEEVGHGFSALDCIYFDSGTGSWEKAVSTNDAKSAIYCVLEVLDADNFNAVKWGRFTVAGHGKTVGEYYYLSSTAGVASSTNPDPATDNFFQLIWQVEDANTINFLVSQPTIIQSTLLIDPMTTNGDMITQSGGVISRLPLGAANTVLYSNGTTPTWGYGIKDEDDMVSNSASALVTQQSVKSYVDNRFSDIILDTEHLHIASDFPNTTNLYGWHLNGTSSYDGTAWIGGITLTSWPGAMTSTTGVLGNTAYCNNNATNLSYTADASLNFTGSFSLSLWAKTTDWTTVGVPIVLASRYTGGSGWRLMVDSGTLWFECDGVIQVSCKHQLGSYGKTDEWHNIQVIRNSGLVTYLLINGCVVDQKNIAGTITNAGNFEIGGGNGANFWSGSIQNVAVHLGTDWTFDQARRVYAASSRKFVTQDSLTNTKVSLHGHPEWDTVAYQSANLVLTTSYQVPANMQLLTNEPGLYDIEVQFLLYYDYAGVAMNDAISAYVELNGVPIPISYMSSTWYTAAVGSINEYKQFLRIPALYIQNGSVLYFKIKRLVGGTGAIYTGTGSNAFMKLRKVGKA